MSGRDHTRDGRRFAASSRGTSARVRSRCPVVMARRASARPRASWSATFDAMNDMVCLLDRDGTVAALQPQHDGVPRPRGRTRSPARSATSSCTARAPSSSGARTRRCCAPAAGRASSWPSASSWYQVTADPLFGDDGAIVGAVHIVRDITDRRRAEDALAERSRWLVDLSALAVDLAALPGDADLGKFLGARLRELTGAVAVAFSEYDPDDRVLATRTIEFQPGVVKTLTAPLAAASDGDALAGRATTSTRRS